LNNTVKNIIILKYINYGITKSISKDNECFSVAIEAPTSQGGIGQLMGHWTVD